MWHNKGNVKRHHFFNCTELFEYCSGLGQNIDIKKILSNARLRNALKSFFNDLYSFSIGPGLEYPGPPRPAEQQQPIRLASDEQIEAARMTEVENGELVEYPMAPILMQGPGLYADVVQLVPMPSQ